MEKSTNQMNKGLNLDVSPLLVSNDSYSFSLNSRINTDIGDFISITNDYGNKVHSIVPNGYKIIGSTYINDDEIVLFITNNINSQIGLINSYGDYISYINSNCLNFNTQYPIKSVFTNYKSTDRVIYFIDGFNKPRYINLDSLDLFYDDGTTINCDKFSLFRNYNKCKITNLSVIKSGGNLKQGSYSFAIRYLDELLNPTNWFYTTSFVDVFDINLIDDTTTNNSIQLTITNLDTTFKYYQLAVIERVSNDDRNSNVFILKEKLIIDSTHTYLYTGTNNVSVVTVLDEIIIPKVTFDKCKSIAYIDDRLVYANTSNREYDWFKFQQLANNIDVQYVVNKVSSTVKQVKSLSRDEVYSIGIIIEFKSGLVSPVFHIPCREADSISVSIGNANLGNTPPATTNWDTDIITNDDGLIIDSPDYRWRVYNTAVKLDNNVNYHSNGEMGYYECLESYPNIKDSNGVPIYPYKTVNNQIVMDKIRHHRIPDTNLEPHCSYDSVTNEMFVYPIGLSLSNINFPSEYLSDIIGYSIVIANKDDSEYTVIDKGIMSLPFITTTSSGGWLSNKKIELGAYLSPSIPFTYGNGFSAQANLDNSNTSLAQYFCGIETPKTKFNKNDVKCDYIKIEGLLSTASQGLDEKYSNGDIFKGAAKLRSFELLPNGYSGKLNYRSAASYYGAYNLIDNNSVNELGYSTVGSNNKARIYHLGSCQSMVYHKLYEENPIYQINNRYGMVGDEDLLPNQYNIYAYYVSIKRIIPNLHSDLEKSVYHRIGSICSNTMNSCVVFDGDNYISSFDVRRNIQNTDSDNNYWKFEDPNNPGSSIHANNKSYISSNINFYVESRINCNYRYRGSLQFQTWYSDNNNILDSSFHIDNNSTITDPLEFVFQEDYFRYNTAYSSINELFPYFTISDLYQLRYYDNKLYNRLWYSEKSFNEDVSDNKRLILANNYRDLDNAITNLFVYNDNLYAHTIKNLFIVPLRPQELQSNENTIYIGTGSYLSIPPKSLVSYVYGYGGSSNFTATSITELGVLFIDELRGKVFLLNDRLNELSANGISKWFMNNSSLNLIKEFERKFTLLNYKYPHKSTYDEFGIGYLTYYDKSNMRLFISKRDFSFNVELKGLVSKLDLNNPNVINSLQTNDLYYDDINLRFVKILKQTVNNVVTITFLKVGFDDKNYFINKSFTLSYSLLNNSWVSFHSFIPNFVYEDSKYFYSYITDVVANNSLYVHNTKSSYTNYYGVKYDHIIEYIVNSNFYYNKMLHSFSYLSNCYKMTNNYYETITNMFKTTDYTFDRVLIYNDEQSTGVLELEINKQSMTQSLTLPNNKMLVNNKNGVWSFNGFRDNAINRDLNGFINSEWNDIKTYYNGTQGYIDYIPKNIDYNKNVYERGRFNINYVRVRLYFKPNDNVLINTNVFTVVNTINR